MALGLSWVEAYDLITDAGRRMCDMPSSDSVWGAVLRMHGFRRTAIPNTTPMDYNAAEFCRDHSHGTYVLGFGGHVATVRNGDLFDSWDSSKEIPQYYWER